MLTHVRYTAWIVEVDEFTLGLHPHCHSVDPGAGVSVKGRAEVQYREKLSTTTVDFQLQIPNEVVLCVSVHNKDEQLCGRLAQKVTQPSRQTRV
ncbi:hypothetical protein ScPMuIL_018353 [Solemya velum]